MLPSSPLKPLKPSLRQHLHCSQRVEAGQLRRGSQVPLERISKGICGSILTPILFPRGPADPTQVLLPVTIATDKNYERCSGRNLIHFLTSPPPPPLSHSAPRSTTAASVGPRPCLCRQAAQRLRCRSCQTRLMRDAAQYNCQQCPVRRGLQGLHLRQLLQGSLRACSVSRQMQCVFPQL
jgi:hypothetical protein